MENIFNKNQIYKITYGMQYSIIYEPIYSDTISFEVDDSIDYIKIPVYAKIINGKLLELVTGTEIPLVFKRKQGFGAQKISIIYSLDDYTNLSVYLKLILQYKDEYKKALEEMINYFSKYNNESYELSEDQQNELDSYKNEVENTIKILLEK